MQVKQADERALGWESSPDVFWVLSYSRSEPGVSASVDAFRLTEASLNEVQAWVRESGFEDVAIGVEMSSPQGLGVMWLVRSPHL